MINKVAEMTRLAEVRGCLAAFHDAGLIKVANDQAFDGLCEQVAGMIGYDYDLEKIAGATDRILSGIKGAFTGAKIKAGKDALSKAKSVENNLFGAKANAREQEAAKKLIRRGKIERALAYSGAGAAGAAGLAGVGYGANAFLND